jgi:positive regulator of sigma E activity
MWLIYLLWPVFMVVSAIVARRRGRSAIGWLLLGILLGPIAVAALFVLPDLAAVPSQPASQEVKEGVSPEPEGKDG